MPIRDHCFSLALSFWKGENPKRGKDPKEGYGKIQKRQLKIGKIQKKGYGKIQKGAVFFSKKWVHAFFCSEVSAAAVFKSTGPKPKTMVALLENSELEVKLRRRWWAPLKHCRTGSHIAEPSSGLLLYGIAFGE